MPGVWVEPDGSLHFSVSAILESQGIPVTPATHAQASTVLVEQLRKLLPGRALVEIDDE